MKEKCLDHVATLVGLDEKTIEEDFKAVDTDEDGKLTLEEGLKVYQYLRETSDSTNYGMCVYDGCAAKIEKPVPPNDLFYLLYLDQTRYLSAIAHLDCTLKATAMCKEDGDCITNPYSIESGDEEVKFFQG